MKKRLLKKTVVNRYKLGNDLLIGHYGNEILSCDKGAVSSRDWLTYRLHYVARGGVVLSFCGKIVELNAPAFFILRPEFAITYSPTPNLTTEIYWVSFTGNFAATYCDLLRLDSAAPFVKVPAQRHAPVRRTFNDIFSHEYDEPLMQNVAFTKTLMTLFFELYRLQPHVDATAERHARPHMQTMIEYVNVHFTDPSLTVASAAQALGFNPDYFSKIFKRETSVPFTRYVAQRRMEYAVSLFQNGATSVSQTAYQCGFTDSLYFSKVFTRYNHVSPTAFIQANRSKPKP